MAKQRLLLDISSLDALLKLSYRKNEFENHEMNDNFEHMEICKGQFVYSPDIQKRFRQTEKRYIFL